jgi:8-oxo-dGTP pyrophosphatase MutT (NUDIX family)
MGGGRHEHSAGFIVFREVAGRREYLVMRDRNYWSFPKGHLEEGEDEPAAARREAREEIGLSDVEVIPGFRRELRYPLPGTGLEKLSVYFAARALAEPDPSGAEVTETRWLALEEVLPLLGFDETREMLREADAFLGNVKGEA